MKLVREQVAVSLILLCGLNSYPLPLSAQNVLQVQDGAISLMVNTDSPCRPAMK